MSRIITQLYAVLMRDDAGEGLAMLTNDADGREMPALGIDAESIRTLIPFVIATGRQFRIVRYDAVADVTDQFVE